MEKPEQNILTQVLELMLNEEEKSIEELQSLEDQLKSMQVSSPTSPSEQPSTNMKVDIANSQGKKERPLHQSSLPNATDPFDAVDPFTSSVNTAQASSEHVTSKSSASNAVDPFDNVDPFISSDNTAQTLSDHVTSNSLESKIKGLETELNLAKQELEDAKDQLTSAKRERTIFEEQAASFQQINEMTVNHLVKELEGVNVFHEQLTRLKEAISKGQESLFNTPIQLTNWFPQSFFFSAHQEEASSVQLYVGERVSLKYIILYRLPFDTDILPLFHLMVHFQWQSSIQSRKFSNASILIEDFERFVGVLAKAFQFPSIHDPFAIVCIIDKQLHEVECSGTNSKVYYRAGSLIKEYTLNELPLELQLKTANGHPIDQGKYQLHQLPLKEGSSIYVSSEKELPNDLLEMLQNLSKEKEDVRHEKLNQFQNKNKALLSSDFNLIGINF